MRAAMACGAALAVAAAAHADVYYTGYELPNFNASAAGVQLGGQEGWYQPVAGGLNHNVHTYAGNAAGFVQNPVGGNQFIAGTSGGGSSFPRAQYNITMGPGTFTAAYDMAALWLGQGSSAVNLASFSLQHDTVPAGQFRQFIALNNFVDLANPAAGWKAEFNVFNAAGTATDNLSPGAAWSNLLLNRWYRQYITFSLTTNEVLSVTLVDLHTGASSTANPSGWYMTGGASSTLAMPNGVRFFVGGAAGNTMGWDNLTIIPTPGAAGLLAMAGVVAARRRRR